MRIAGTVKETRKIIDAARRKNKTIGFVPTMGALHSGHISLVRAAKKSCDFVAVSIFVNPTQFGPKEDFKKYPRVLNKDTKLLKREKVDLVFCPSADEIYPEGFSTLIEEGSLSKPLCGLSRPGHFRGVCTVVAKLFNIITPDFAYFGHKDYQQAQVIKRMASDLNFKTKVKVCPTIREHDGLAMSSRNAYLSPDERTDALVLYDSLMLTKKNIIEGERNSKKLINAMRKLILSKKSARINYIEIVDAESLKKVDKIQKDVLIALAVYVGKTRLIDNMVASV